MSLKLKISPKQKCHQNANVTKYKCHQNAIITKRKCCQIANDDNDGGDDEKILYIKQDIVECLIFTYYISYLY